MQTLPPFDHSPSSCSVWRMSAVCRILTMRATPRRKEKRGKRERVRRERKWKGDTEKRGRREGGNITPRVPVIRPRARDDNAKIPGHRRRFCPPSSLLTARVPSFSRYLHAPPSPSPIITTHFSFSPFLSPEQLLNTTASSFFSANTRSTSRCLLSSLLSRRRLLVLSFGANLANNDYQAGGKKVESAAAR